MSTESERCVDFLIESSNKIDELLTDIEKNNSDELIQKGQNLMNDTQAFVNNNKEAVPPYILMKINNALQKLERCLLESVKSKISFKFKSSAPSSTKITANKSDDEPKERQQTVVETRPTDNSAKFFGLKDIDGGDHSLNREEVHLKDISLIDLSNCSVRITGLANTVYVRNLINVTATVQLACRAIQLTNCIDCKFQFVCQQLRIDSAQNCEFEIFTSARSMIESSKGLIFKPIKFDDASELSDLIKKANFNPSLNNWKFIDDFDWLCRDRASVNYKLVG